MSDFASNSYSVIEYIDYGSPAPPGEEAAGKVGKFLGVIAAIAIPFAAPAIFGAIAGSGFLGSTIGGLAAGGGLSGAVTSALGSAVTGTILGMGNAYLGGARGNEMWQQGLMSGLGAGITGGIGGWAGADAGLAAGGAKAGLAANSAKAADIAANAAVNGTNAVGGLGPMALTPGAAAVATPATMGATAATAGPSTGIMNGIRGVLGNVDGETMRRVGAALVNAAVNGQAGGAMQGLVDQQRAELEALRASDLAAYNQRISIAQQTLADADRMDPEWHARIAMADVAGMEANQFRQTLRNMVTREGGQFDDGQQKAYQRSASLHTARSKALTYNQKRVQAQGVQSQMRAQAGALFGPNTAGFQNWQSDTELEAAKLRADDERRQSTWGGLTRAVTEGDFAPSTSPDPSAQQNQDDDGPGGFAAGLRTLFGRG